MSTNAVSVYSNIVRRLIENGIIPPQCRRWELLFEVGHVFLMRSEVFVTSEQLEVIEKVLNEFPNEAQSFARTVFSTLEKDSSADLTAIGDEWTHRSRPRK